MKNKRIKKGFIIGMSAMMLASAVAPVDAQAATWKKNKTGWWWLSGQHMEKDWWNLVLF